MTWRPIIEAEPDLFGALAVPRDGNLLPSVGRWAADNGAFSGFDEALYLKMLQRHEPDRHRCLFATAPDVVADAEGTLALFSTWGDRIRAMGYPVALVGQDGMTVASVDWDAVDAVFLGGSTEWKLSFDAARIVSEAKRRGIWAHMGRVNTVRRIKYAAAIGCDSIDGSGWSRFPLEMLRTRGHALRSLQLPLAG